MFENFLEIAAAPSFPVIPTMCFIPPKLLTKGSKTRSWIVKIQCRVLTAINNNERRHVTDWILFQRPWQSATDFKVFVYCLAVIVKILGLKATPISWLSHVRRVMKVKDKVKWQKMQKTTDRQHSSLLQLDTKPWLLPRWNSEGIRRTTTFHPLKPIGSTKRLKQWLTQ